jgi:hypothetical protein
MKVTNPTVHKNTDNTTFHPPPTHTCTFVSESSLVLLPRGDNVSQGALNAANVIMTTDIINVFPIIHIQHYKPQLLDLFKTIFHQKCL